MLMVGIPKARRARGEQGRLSASNARSALDEIVGTCAFCHLGYTVDGLPFVAPALSWREDAHFYLMVSRPPHEIASSASGLNIFVTVSANQRLAPPDFAPAGAEHYRSAVLSGRAHPVGGARAKLALLGRFLARLPAGSAQSLRRPDAKQIKTTAILRVDLDQACVKADAVRRDDDAAGYGCSGWTGEIRHAVHNFARQRRKAFADETQQPYRQ